MTGRRRRRRRRRRILPIWGGWSGRRRIWKY